MSRYDDPDSNDYCEHNLCDTRETPEEKEIAGLRRELARYQQAELPEEPKQFISELVDCPWCIARAGEKCFENMHRAATVEANAARTVIAYTDYEALHAFAARMKVERDYITQKLTKACLTNQVVRLNNICAALEEQKVDSPYSAESWDHITEENNELRKRAEAAERRAQEFMGHLGSVLRDRGFTDYAVADIRADITALARTAPVQP